MWVRVSASRSVSSVCSGDLIAEFGFNESNPELFSEYQTARKLVHLPTKEKSTKAAVKPESATTKAKPAATSVTDKSKVA